MERTTQKEKETQMEDRTATALRIIGVEIAINVENTWEEQTNQCGAGVWSDDPKWADNMVEGHRDFAWQRVGEELDRDMVDSDWTTILKAI